MLAKFEKKKDIKPVHDCIKYSDFEWDTKDQKITNLFIFPQIPLYYIFYF